MAKNSIATFEKTLSQLENIVNTLEAGDMPLDKAMKQFEQGVKLSNSCQKTLADAQAKVQVLIDNNLQDLNEQ